MRIIIVLILISVFFGLTYKVASLSNKLSNVKKEVNLYIEKQQLDVCYIDKQRKSEDEINKIREEREVRLNGTDCTSVDMHLDNLLQLLEEDAISRSCNASRKSSN